MYFPTAEPMYQGGQAAGAGAATGDGIGSNLVLLNQFVEMLKEPLIIAVVFLVFQSDVIKNFAVRVFPISVSFEGELDMFGWALIALAAGAVASVASKAVLRFKDA